MKVLLHLAKIRNLVVMSLLLTFFLLANVDSFSNFTQPRLPKLSLTGDGDQSYDTDFYPDGVIWVPPSTDGSREFLVPVFITNNWFDYQNAQGVALYRVKPIQSFDFSIFYNGEAIRAVGVETVHPSYVEMDYEPLAKYFEPTIDDVQDNYYWYYINPDKWADTKDNVVGRRLKITGKSFKVLPETDNINVNYKVLLYVRFKVLPVHPLSTSRVSPIYIDNRNVTYNELNAATDPIWKGFLDYDLANYQSVYTRDKIGNLRGRLDSNLYYPDTYLSGLNNATNQPDESSILPGPLTNNQKFITEPVYPGVITLKITDNVPKFRVSTITDEELPLDQNSNGSLYELNRTVSVDDNSPEQFGVARIKISNSVSSSRINDILIETDQDWLMVAVDPLNQNKGFRVKMTDAGRKGTIRWIDNGILGSELDPVMATTNDDGDVLVEVRCDPSKIVNRGDVPHGLHTGYITLKSPSVDVKPVRIKVNFLYIRNPYEPDWSKVPGNPGGINITMTNRIGEVRRLIFGTGDRATEWVDPLYGEAAYANPLSTTTFDARFYPTNPAVKVAVPHGFADITPNIDNPRTNSRDIRPFVLPNGVNSWTYHCQFFNANANYPITIQWDTRDFPVGSYLYLKPIINGEAGQGIDMNQGTQVNDFVRSYTITDMNVKGYFIEYTPAKSMLFVDRDGNPRIKTGWNLLSLPVLPQNTYWNNVYKNALNKPLSFVNSLYQGEDYLKFGLGYFVKYSTQIDRSFTGSMIQGINKNDHGVRVYKGSVLGGAWNLVGALSVVTSIEGIAFQPILISSPTPDPEFTKRHGIWAYRTDLGYYQVSNLAPGLGYWIKVDEDGYFELKSVYPNPPLTDKVGEVPYDRQVVMNNSQAFEIKDNGQSSAKVYMTNIKEGIEDGFEYPPTPMSDLFDVRFSNNKYLINTNEGIVKVQGVNYPIVVNVEDANADYTLMDPVDGNVIAEIKAGETKSIKIDNLKYGAFKVKKTEVLTGLSNDMTVYPNPAKDFTTVSFSLTQNSNVTIEIYNELGNLVETIANGDFANGPHYLSVNLSKFGNGTYFAKIRANNYNSVVKFNVVK